MDVVDEMSASYFAARITVSWFNGYIFQYVKYCSHKCSSSAVIDKQTRRKIQKNTSLLERPFSETFESTNSTKKVQPFITRKLQNGLNNSGVYQQNKHSKKTLLVRDVTYIQRQTSENQK